MNDKNKLSIGSNANNLVNLFVFNSVQIEESFDRRTLDTISEGILEMGKDLEQLAREKIDCLKTVIKCKEYIFWLREELKGKWFFSGKQITNDRQLTNLFLWILYRIGTHERGFTSRKRDKPC